MTAMTTAMAAPTATRATRATATRATGRTAAQAARVRLTRRGRLAVVASVVAGIGAGGGLLGHAAASAQAPVPTRTVTVQPGETLWTLAERIAPGADPRVTVVKLEQANHLPSAAVAAGQRLVVSGL